MTELTPELLSEIEKLEREASPGPWRAGRSDTVTYGAENVAYKNVYGRETDRHPRTGMDIPVEVARGQGEQCVEDAQLIAARNDLPALIGAAGRLLELESALEFLQIERPDLRLSGVDYTLALAKTLGWTPPGEKR